MTFNWLACITKRMSLEDAKPRGAQPGNKNAQKEEGDGLDATQTFRCKKTELASWKAKAKAKDIKFALYIRTVLNKDSGHEPPE